MFKFKSTSQTYSDPVSSIFKAGVPFGREYSAGDICLLHDEITSSKIFLNSKILRDAILNSKEFLEEILELSIEDARVVYSAEPKKVEKPKVEKPTEVVKNEEVQEKTLLADDSVSGGEVPEEQKTETEVEVKSEEPVGEPIVVEEVIGNPKKKKK